MTIIVTGDNQLAKDSLSAALFAVLDRAVISVDNIREIDNWSRVSVLLIEYGAVTAHDFALLRRGVPAAVKLALYSAPAVADEATAWLGRGCDGYLPRSMGAPAILCAVHLMLRGERFVPSIAIGQAVAEPKPAENGLSPRQREVLSMVATGASNKHIARALQVEEVTVKSHVKAIFRKLGVRSRTEAARYVLVPGRSEMGGAAASAWLS